MRNYPAISGAGMTQEEIAREMGITRQRVEQIERRALQKLRRKPLMLAKLVALAEELDAARRAREVIEP